MKWIRRVQATLRFGKHRREVEEELAFHLALREERIRDERMAPGAARRAARLRFGNPVVRREQVNEIDLMPFALTVLGDLRFGARLLLRPVGFTAAEVPAASGSVAGDASVAPAREIAVTWTSSASALPLFITPRAAANCVGAFRLAPAAPAVSRAAALRHPLGTTSRHASIAHRRIRCVVVTD